MKDKSNATDFLHLNAVTFMWEIWYACNYRCTYCPWEMANSWEKMAKKNRVVPAAEWIACWDRIHSKYGASHLYLLGGEPLLYPGIEELLRGVSKKHYLSIITNLSLPLDTIKRFAKELPPERVRFGPSFHPQFADLDEFVEKTVVLNEAGFQPWVSIVAWPPFVDKLQGYKDAFTKRGIPPIVQTFFGTYEGKQYPQAFTAEEKSEISAQLPEDNPDLEPYGLREQSTFGKPCMSGHIYSKVLADGDVHRCGSVVDYDNPPPPMGNILNPDFALWSGPTPCPRLTCRCGESANLWENYVKEHPASGRTP